MLKMKRMVSIMVVFLIAVASVVYGFRSSKCHGRKHETCIDGIVDFCTNGSKDQELLPDCEAHCLNKFRLKVDSKEMTCCNGFHARCRRNRFSFSNIMTHKSCNKSVFKLMCPEVCKICHRIY